MSVDVVQLYGPGMSYYRARPKSQIAPKAMLKSSLSSSFPPLQRYAASLRSLHASNNELERRIQKLRYNTVQLKLDLIKLQRHVKAFNGELLVTWQADTLTRLIEVIYAQHGWKLPGGVTPNDHGVVDRARMSTMYEVAARKLKKETLERRYRLPREYFDALQKYEEIVHLRSTDPFRTECTFARWLISRKEDQPSQYRFWGRLFPLCYNRTVEEASEIF